MNITWADFWATLRAIKTTLGWLALAASIYLVFSITTAWRDTMPPIVTRGPTEVVTPDVPRGGVLRLVRNIDRTRFCPGRVSRYHLDNLGIPHLAASYDFPIPPAKEAERQLKENIHQLFVEIPVGLDMPPGEAQYQGRVLYYCNWLQRILDKPIVVETETVKYNVLPEEAKEIKKPKRNSKNTRDFPAIQNRPYEAP